MKKKMLFLSILFLGGLFLAAETPLITIVSPNGSYPLIKNETETIHWTYSAYFTTHPQNCRIFFGSHVISPPVPVTAGAFTWTVGHKADGTTIPQGKYKITIESPDYDALNGPQNILIDEEERIDITAPPNDTDLFIGSSCNITWTYTYYYHLVPQTCVVFCGDHMVSSPIPVLNGSFSWKVGKKKDGTMLPPGRYQITIESDDYDALNGPHVNLKSRVITIDKGKFMKFYFKKIPIIPIPHCPRCFKIDPRNLQINPGNLPGPVTMEIIRGNQILAKLGPFAPGKPLPGPVQIKLSKEQKLSVKNRQPGYRLRIRSAKGEILQENAVQLEIAR